MSGGHWKLGRGCERSLHGTFTPVVVADPGADGAGSALPRLAADLLFIRPGSAIATNSGRAQCSAGLRSSIRSQPIKDVLPIRQRPRMVLYHHLCQCRRTLSARAGFASGLELARHWRSANPHVPVTLVTADLIYLPGVGQLRGGPICVSDRQIKAQLRRAVTAFTATDSLMFDPLAEPVPNDVPGRALPAGTRMREACACAAPAIAAGDEEPL